MRKLRFIFSALIGLYLNSSAFACTGIMLKNSDNSIVSGRTVEFGINLDISILFIPRNYSFISLIDEGQGLKYQSKYAVIGAMAFNDVNILDGINEKGLTAGAFYFPSFAEYSKIDKENQEKALSPTGVINWILTQFANVEEVENAIKREEIVIAPTILAGWGPETPPFHYIVYDKTGKSLVLEPILGKIKIYENSLGVLTNSPSFDWHMINLRNYIALNPRNVPELVIDQQTFKQLGQGNGLVGMPGDFSPPSRFVRASIFSRTAIASKNAREGVLQLFHILNNFDIPIGSVREIINGVTHTDSTLLTCARDSKDLLYYYKTYEDQTIRMLDLKKLNPNSAEISRFKIQEEQSIIDMTKDLTRAIIK